MVELADEIIGATGKWVRFEESDGAQLTALVHSEEIRPDPGVTIYWPAKFDPAAFANFFDEALPKIEELGAFRPPLDRRRYYVRNTAVEAEWPPALGVEGVDFIRFERVRSFVGDERPDLVVWANLDAGKADAIPGDAAGILVQPHDLIKLQPLLAALISKTSAEEPAETSLELLLDGLEQYLRPEPAPAPVPVPFP